MPAQTQITQNQLTKEQIALLKSLVTPEMIHSYADIVQLLFQTPSLGFEEKKYWLELLPFMSEQHVERLRNILVTERKKMNDLEVRYQGALKEVEGAGRMTHEETSKLHQKLKQEEKLSQQQEQHVEENILSQLDEL